MDEVKGPAGFFNSAGRLRTREELQEADRKLARNQNTKEGSKAEAVSAEFAARTKDAFRKIRSNVSQQASKLITQVNDQLDSVKSARDITNQQIAVAKDLKAALKSNDTETAEALRQELSELNEAAKEIEEEIQTKNYSSVSDRLGSIRVGNDQKATFKVPDVQFSATSGELNTLKAVEDVNRFLADARETRLSLRQQIGGLKELRSEIRDVARSARVELGEMSDGVLETVEAAESKAAVLAGKLKFAADEDVSGVIKEVSLQTVHNLTEDAVTRLIQS